MISESSMTNAELSKAAKEYISNAVKENQKSLKRK